MSVRVSIDQAPGDSLLALCESAVNEVMLVAPFMKQNTVSRVFEAIPDGVEVYCVTRWHPSEIVQGVSDLEVWSIVRNRGSSSLRLLHNLHAKYYRIDDYCLVGSANLTNAGLGWSPASNLELLVGVPFADPELRKLDKKFRENSIEVDDSVYQAMVTLAAQFRVDEPSFTLRDASANYQVEPHNPNLNDRWLPTLRYPEQLYQAYSGNLDSLTRAAQEMAMNDLQALSLPLGLSKSAFEASVGMLLLQMPMIKAIDDYVIRSRRFGAVRDLLSSLPCSNDPNFNPTRAWQTLMRWLLHFLPKRYGLSVPNVSEVFYRRSDSNDIP